MVKQNKIINSGGISIGGIKTINGIEPDENGNIELNFLPMEKDTGNVLIPGNLDIGKELIVQGDTIIDKKLTFAKAGIIDNLGQPINDTQATSKVYVDNFIAQGNKILSERGELFKVTNLQDGLSLSLPPQSEAIPFEVINSMPSWVTIIEKDTEYLFDSGIYSCTFSFNLNTPRGFNWGDTVTIGLFSKENDKNTLLGSFEMEVNYITGVLEVINSRLEITNNASQYPLYLAIIATNVDALTTSNATGVAISWSAIKIK